MRREFLVFAGPLTLIGVVACAQMQTVNATIAADLPTAKQAVQAAINLYQIDKGIAQVAMVADPALAPLLTPAIAFADPLVAKAQTALSDAAADVALASQIQSQADALAATAAPAITVVPNK